VSSEASDSFFFRSMADMSELEGSQALGFSGSVTFPVDVVKVGAKRTLDFSNSTKSSNSVLLIVLDWERLGSAKRVSPDAMLRNDASAMLTDQVPDFRHKYGDYFVYQISYQVKFTAVMKCTAENNSKRRGFEQEISGSLTASDVSVEGSFTTKLRSAANKYNVTVEVEYSVVGNADSTHYDQNDVVKTFNAFRGAGAPVPYKVFLRHYSMIESTVPRTINMDVEVYELLSKAFQLARFVVFLIGVVPGIRSVRMKRREEISDIFSSIYANRVAYGTHHIAMRTSLDELTALYKLLWTRLERQDLVMEMHSMTYEDMKKKFVVDHENERGAWVKASQNVGSYVLGRIGFSSLEKGKDAVHERHTAAEVRVDSALLKQQVGALEFPGTTGINGYVVGLTIESCWTDGTNGWWCIGSQLTLGTKQAKVEVKTAGSRGMHWRLHVHYIPAAEYDE
jgi:hypothetical protein